MLEIGLRIGMLPACNAAATGQLRFAIKEQLP